MTKILLGNVKGPKGDTGPARQAGSARTAGPCRRHWRDRGHRSKRRGRPTRRDRVACLDITRILSGYWTSACSDFDWRTLSLNRAPVVGEYFFAMTNGGKNPDVRADHSHRENVTFKPVSNTSLVGPKGDKGETGMSASQAFIAAHPVGSLYWTTATTNPGTTYGGTWKECNTILPGHIYQRTA